MALQSVVCVLVAAYLAVCHAVTWERPEGRLVSVSAGPSGVWGANAQNEVYYRQDTYRYPTRQGSDWIQLPDRALKQVDVGTNVVWGVSTADNIFYRLGISTQSPGGVTWVRVEGRLKHVTVSPGGYVWGVNSNDQVYYREGASSCEPGGRDWVNVRGALAQISAGYAGVWGVNARNDVFYRSGTYGDNGSMGDDWVKVEGRKISYVSSGDGQVLALDKWGKVFRREGVTPDTPTGTGWTRVGDKNLAAIDSYGVIFWGVDSDDKIHLATL